MYISSWAYARTFRFSLRYSIGKQKIKQKMKLCTHTLSPVYPRASFSGWDTDDGRRAADVLKAELARMRVVLARV